MQVLISDDASEDGTFAELKNEVDSYRGRHRISLHRRAQNSGSKSAHLNDILQKASGDIIVSFDGDDISDPSRVRKIVEIFRLNPQVRAVFSSYSLIDETSRTIESGNVPHPPSNVDGAAWFASVDAYAAGTTLAIHRAVVDKFDPLNPEINEDVVLPFRASLLGEVRYLDEELVKARRLPYSLTQDIEVYESVENYRSRFFRGIDQSRKCREARLADLRTATALFPERAEKLSSLEEIVSASMANAEISAGLVSPSPLDRIRALFKLKWNGYYREGFTRDICLAFAPNLFLRYKRRTLRAGNLSDQNRRKRSTAGHNV